MLFSKFVIIGLITVMAFANNIPSIHQVYQAAESGNLNGAHQMIEQVLNAHPESAKAHYVDAEILARQGDLSSAKTELVKAEQLSPGLPFAKPQSVQSLKQHLSMLSSMPNSATLTGTPQSTNSPIPWMMIIMAVGAVLLIWLAIRAFSSRNTNGYPPQYNGGNSTSGVNPNQNNPYGQPYPPQSSGLGGGIMSGLATGAAAGVGFVAGEELIHHFMDGSSSNNNANNVNNTQIVNTEPSNEMGGNDFGLEDSSSWDSSSSDDMSSDDNW
jgi:hypothetical protein